jgi:predicted ATPase
MSTDTQMASWRAVEALRAGVPNRDAVQVLGCSHPNIEERVRQMLAAVEGEFPKSAAPEGILIAGDFGAGKSHLLEYLQHIALENNFVCSKVVISKETLFTTPAKCITPQYSRRKCPTPPAPL